MQPIGTPCQRMAWVVALATASFLCPSWAFALPPPGMRVSFDKHGSDWAQGNCASRKKQSPIDLNEMFKPPGADFQYKYDDVLGRDVEITNDGRMLSATLMNGSFSEIGGLFLDLRGEPHAFKLASIDIKSESEHTIRGKHYPLEIQLVHKPAHYYPGSGGPESVTVSIFVDCPNPPKAPQVWPGLLQERTKPSRQLRGERKTAFVQQIPDQSDAVMPEEAGVDPEEPVDDDPMHQRMDAEVNFMRTLTEGEDSMAASPAAAAPAAAPGGAPAAVEEIYSPPSPMQANYNPLLQFLVAQEPPDLDSAVNISLGPATPLNLNTLLGGGTYFYYWGSTTLPPCAEEDLWLIKREVTQASTEQVKALYDTLHLMSSGAGNYRTGMPLNQRAVQVLAGKEGIPTKLQPARPYNEKATGKEQQYISVAKDAITIAKAASDYAKDLDWRIQAASTAHLRAMEAPPATTQAPTTSAFIPAPPLDQIWAANIMAKLVKKGIHDAMQANIDEMVPATASLATSYLRQRLLKKAGFGPPPIGARVISPKPIPGVPTFFPPVQYEQPSEQNMTDLADMLAANGCSAASNFSGCGNISGMTPAEAQRIAEYQAANTETNPDDEADAEAVVITPEQVAATLPAGVAPVPADWPDPDAWPQGLPPANWPVGADLSVWPDPDGARPAGYTDYQWERYRYNWRIYRSSYVPYRSSYSGYSISRRRRMRGRHRSSRRRSSSRSSRSGRRRSSSRMSSSRRRSSSRSSSSSRRRSSSSYGRRASSSRRRSSYR